MSAGHWEERYRSREQMFSGEPNAVLVAEAADLPPGRALDVGCGEGADAAWLARRGWQVTAVDISDTALHRAAAAAVDVADRIAWTRADLTGAQPWAGGFDLVSAHYVPLRRQPDHGSLRRLLDAVAPGGTLLFVSHDLAEVAARPESGVGPADYYRPGEVAGLLDHDWTVLVDGVRPRSTPAPPGTRHTRDVVLRARRRPVPGGRAGQGVSPDRV